MSRSAQITRETSETSIRAAVTLESRGSADIATRLPFLDHMLTTLARHARIDIALACEGDIHIDDHHTVEDVALTLGAAIDKALSDRRGIRRFASAYAPLDESLARAVIDLSGRPCAVINLDLRREKLGDVAAENLTHFFRSLATALRAALHIDVLRGDNDHHKAEAAFKSLALALREAVALDGSTEIPSTKGSL
ncbi:MAG: imidazoleglycerol-phosphate dehydratase HisB [Planctomycetota bacterium]|nr:imidazoleglycerol-phosphate dehydratase HisB [Planctomycetota bacterium]